MNCWSRGKGKYGEPSTTLAGKDMHELVRAFSLECGQDGLDHSSANPLSLAATHQVNVKVGGVASLKLVR